MPFELSCNAADTCNIIATANALPKMEISIAQPPSRNGVPSEYPISHPIDIKATFLRLDSVLDESK